MHQGEGIARQPQAATAPFETAADLTADVGESPLWNAAAGSLLWVDLLRGQLWELQGVSNRLLTTVNEPLGFVAPSALGGLVAGTKAGIGALDPDAGFDLHLPIEPDRDAYRINDGACDPCGRLWLGTMSDSVAGGGRLLRVDAGWKVGFERDGLGLPNGIGWTCDGATMWVADSEMRTIEVWDYDLERGLPVELRLRFEVPVGWGNPDGLEVDLEGCAWVCFWGGGAIRRLSPAGDLLREIELPAPLVAGCALGGPEFRDLYVTSARYEMSADELATWPQSGAIFRATVEVGGWESDAYRP